MHRLRTLAPLALVVVWFSIGLLAAHFTRV